MKIAAFWENPEKIWSKFCQIEIQQNSGKSSKILFKKSADVQQFLTKKIMLENGAGSLFPSFRLWIPKTVQRSAFCTSRRELSNEYLPANFDFDTAENEPSYFVSSSSRKFEFEL